MTTNEQIDTLAREFLGEMIGAPVSRHDIDLLLTFAKRVAALKVKESGAFELLDAFLGCVPKGLLTEDDLKSLNALKAIITDGGLAPYTP